MTWKHRFRISLLLVAIMAILTGHVTAAAALVQVPPFELPVAGNFILATTIVAFLMSPAIDALNRRSWSSELKAIAAFGWCVLAAVLLFAAGDRFDLQERTPSVLFGTVMAVFVLAITLHRFYWKPSGISDRIANATG